MFKTKAGQLAPLATASWVATLRATAQMNRPGHRGATTFLQMAATSLKSLIVLQWGCITLHLHLHVYAEISVVYNPSPSFSVTPVWIRESNITER